MWFWFEKVIKALWLIYSTEFKFEPGWSQTSASVQPIHHLNWFIRPTNLNLYFKGVYLFSFIHLWCLVLLLKWPAVYPQGPLSDNIQHICFNFHSHQSDLHVIVNMSHVTKSSAEGLQTPCLHWRLMVFIMFNTKQLKQDKCNHMTATSNHIVLVCSNMFRTAQTFCGSYDFIRQNNNIVSLLHLPWLKVTQHGDHLN